MFAIYLFFISSILFAYYLDYKRDKKHFKNSLLGMAKFILIAILIVLISEFLSKFCNYIFN
jgi:hypothetical protein